MVSKSFSSHFSTCHGKDLGISSTFPSKQGVSAGVYISVRKWYLFPPPLLKNDIFSPSRDMSFFDSHRGLFALILPYFEFILPFYFPFSHFLSPFLLFLSPFFLFLSYFPLFSLCLFIFFPPNDISWYFPPQGGYFPINRPLCFC